MKENALTSNSPASFMVFLTLNGFLNYSRYLLKTPLIFMYIATILCVFLPAYVVFPVFFVPIAYPLVLILGSGEINLGQEDLLAIYMVSSFVFYLIGSLIHRVFNIKLDMSVQQKIKFNLVFFTVSWLVILPIYSVLGIFLPPTYKTFLILFVLFFFSVLVSLMYFGFSSILDKIQQNLQR